ncbi:hypothetical protein ACO2FN_08715 [Staphylococcus epidermidis]
MIYTVVINYQKIKEASEQLQNLNSLTNGQKDTILNHIFSCTNKKPSRRKNCKC